MTDFVPRTPVPALGEGWYLLTEEDGELQLGDQLTVDSNGNIGWVLVKSGLGSTLKDYPRCLAARYFGPATEPKPTPVAKPIDWTKPVRTKKHKRPVRILCTDRPHKFYPVVGYVGDRPEIRNWSLEGIELIGHEGPFDLENAPQRIQREYWVNVYKDEACIPMHQTLEEANRCADDDRIACVKITIDCEEGEGL